MKSDEINQLIYDKKENIMACCDDSSKKIIFINFALVATLQ